MGWAHSDTKPLSQSIGVALTAGVHFLVIGLLLQARMPMATAPAPIHVAVISDAVQQQEVLQRAAEPRLNTPVLHVPQPDLVLAEERPVNAPATVVSTAPVSTAPAAPMQTEPVFDADYLNNPVPSYPPLARRLKEEGIVLVRVLVTPDGLPDQIELKRSSGSARLDEAALGVVKQWRFVPARRGGQTIAAWVVVPIAFSLTA